MLQKRVYHNLFKISLITILINLFLSPVKAHPIVKNSQENLTTIEIVNQTLQNHDNNNNNNNNNSDNNSNNNDNIIIEDSDSLPSENSPENEEIKEQITVEETPSENQLSPEEIARLEKFKQADQLYLTGNINEAEKLYRELKEPFSIETENVNQIIPQPYYDPQLLPTAGAVYWRMSAQGLEQNLQSKIFIPLKFLVEQFPDFIPAYLRYAQALIKYEKLDEAIKILDQAVTLYPNETDLLLAKIEADNKAEKWLDASLAARRFVLLNPDHPQAEKFLQLADQNLAKYQEKLQSDITGNAIANIFTGALGFVLTGNIFGPLSALETTMLLLQGETGIGEQISAQVKEQIPLLEDEEVKQYITEIGQKIINVTGRNDFNYEFNLIMDDELNAFALPGGKVFVNIGAILKTNSEAQLAGLLAHEISHAVLSHSFQLVTQGNLTANVIGNIPYIGGIATNLIVLNYSREMEQEADTLGTRILANSGYAADGVRNLMEILAGENEDQTTPPAWLSTHPNTNARVEYLEAFIIKNGFNRYAYEGVTRHQEIKAKVQQLWEEYQQTDEYKERELNNR